MVALGDSFLHCIHNCLSDYEQGIKNKKIKKK